MTAGVTLILGPQTPVALALNALVRTGRARLATAGLRALPSRVASPFLRRCLEPHRQLAERKAEFARETAGTLSVLSSVNFLGPPQIGPGTGSMFPDAVSGFQRLGDIAGAARIVLLPDSLPAFFLASASVALEAKVRGTAWETLYELGWADMARALVEALPKATLLVLTPEGAALRSRAAIGHIFQDAATALDPLALTRPAVSETGNAVLKRLEQTGTPDERMLGELYAYFAVRPDHLEIRTRLGIEKITATLLDQRFADDMDAIRSLPRTEVI